MGSVRVKSILITDDGVTDGIFWRDGFRYLRERGKETRLIDLAPHLESHYMIEIELGTAAMSQILAHQKSKEQ